MITIEDINKISEHMFPFRVEPHFSAGIIDYLVVSGGVYENYYSMAISNKFVKNSRDNLKNHLELIKKHMSNSIKRELIKELIVNGTLKEECTEQCDIICNIDCPIDRKILLVHPAELNNMRRRGETVIR